jgi:hypothetical protein
MLKNRSFLKQIDKPSTVKAIHNDNIRVGLFFLIDNKPNNARQRMNSRL